MNPTTNRRTSADLSCWNTSISWNGTINKLNEDVMKDNIIFRDVHLHIICLMIVNWSVDSDMIFTA